MSVSRHLKNPIKNLRFLLQLAIGYMNNVEYAVNDVSDALEKVKDGIEDERDD